MERGAVSTWEAMENLWQHCLYNLLQVNPGNHPLLIAEAVNNPKSHKEKMVEIFFEVFQVPSFFTGYCPVYSLAA